MNPVHTIGRYDLPIFNVVVVKKRQGIRANLFSLWLTVSMFIISMIEGTDFDGWQSPGYDALLNDGHKIHFTEAEKAQYDETMEWHAVTGQWFGMARGMGLRG